MLNFITNKYTNKNTISENVCVLITFSIQRYKFMRCGFFLDNYDVESIF